MYTRGQERRYESEIRMASGSWNRLSTSQPLTMAITRPAGRRARPKKNTSKFRQPVYGLEGAGINRTAKGSWMNTQTRTGGMDAARTERVQDVLGGLPKTWMRLR